MPHLQEGGHAADSDTETGTGAARQHHHWADWDDRHLAGVRDATQNYLLLRPARTPVPCSEMLHLAWDRLMGNFEGSNSEEGRLYTRQGAFRPHQPPADRPG